LGILDHPVGLYTLPNDFRDYFGWKEYAAALDTNVKNN
jgi:hypothetical protein